MSRIIDKRVMGVFITLALILTLFAGGVVSVVNPANAVSGNDDPYTSLQLTKKYDGTGHGTPNATFVNTKNGYYPGDDTPTDGVVTTSDYVGYNMRVGFQAGPARTVVVSLKMPEGLEFSRESSSQFCASTNVIKGSYTHSATNPTCTYEIPRGTPIQIDSDFSILAKDTGGKTLNDQILTVEAVRSGGVTKSSGSADPVTVTSAVSADLRIVGDKYDNRRTVSDRKGYFSVIPSPIRHKDYANLKGVAKDAPWTAQLDVSELPDGTTYSYKTRSGESGKLSVSGGKLDLPETAGIMDVYYQVPDEDWGQNGGIPEGNGKRFKVHLIVPNSAFQVGDQKNHGDGWQPGTGEDENFNTSDPDKNRGYVVQGGLNQFYNNNDYAPVYVYRPTPPPPGEIFSLSAVAPTGYGKSDWERERKFWEFGKSERSWRWNPGVAPTSETRSYLRVHTNNIRTNSVESPVLSLQWKSGELLPGGEIEVYNPAGEKMTSGFKAQWSVSKGYQGGKATPGKQIINNSDNNGWVTSLTAPKNANAFRITFDSVPTGSMDGAGTYYVKLPLNVYDYPVEAGKASEILPQVMYGSVDGTNSSGGLMADWRTITPTYADSVFELGNTQDSKTGEMTFSDRIFDREKGTVEFSLSPRISELMDTTSTVGGKVEVTTDACMTTFDIAGTKQWKLEDFTPGTDCGLKTAKPGKAVLTISTSNYSSERSRFSDDRVFSDLPTIKVSSKVPQYAVDSVDVSADWTLTSISGGNAKFDENRYLGDYQGTELFKLKPPTPARASASIPIEALGVSTQRLNTTTPKIEIGDDVKFHASIVNNEDTAYKTNRTVIVMPGKGDDKAFLKELEEVTGNDAYDGSKNSNFSGTVDFAGFSKDSENSTPNLEILCTTKTNPNFDPNQAGANWSTNCGPNTTAIQVVQKPSGHVVQQAELDFTIKTAGNKKDDVYLAWIGPTYTDDVKSDVMAWPDESIAVASSITGVAYWDNSGRGEKADEKDPKLSEIKVDLLDKTDKVVKTTKTDKNGVYKFEDLRSGEYEVRFAEIGATDGPVDKIKSRYYDDKNLDVKYSYIYPGKRLVLAYNSTGKFELGLDEHKTEVDYGVYALDPYSDTDKKVGNVDCGVNGKNEVCEVTWLVTVKNGDDSEDPADGTLRGASQTLTGAKLTDFTSSDVFDVKASIGEGVVSTVYADYRSDDILAFTGDYYKPQVVATETGVYSVSGIYQGNRKVKKINEITGDPKFAIGSHPETNGFGVATTNGYWVGNTQGEIKKVEGISGEILEIKGDFPYCSDDFTCGSMVRTNEGFWIVDEIGKAKIVEGVGGRPVSMLYWGGGFPSYVSADYKTHSKVWRVERNGGVTEITLPNGKPFKYSLSLYGNPALGAYALSASEYAYEIDGNTLNKIDAYTPKTLSLLPTGSFFIESTFVNSYYLFAEGGSKRIEPSGITGRNHIIKDISGIMGDFQYAVLTTEGLWLLSETGKTRKISSVSSYPISLVKNSSNKFKAITVEGEWDISKYVHSKRTSPRKVLYVRSGSSESTSFVSPDGFHADRYDDLVLKTEDRSVLIRNLRNGKVVMNTRFDGGKDTGWMVPELEGKTIERAWSYIGGSVHVLVDSGKVYQIKLKYEPNNGQPVSEDTPEGSFAGSKQIETATVEDVTGKAYIPKKDSAVRNEFSVTDYPLDNALQSWFSPFQYRDLYKHDSGMPTLDGDKFASIMTFKGRNKDALVVLRDGRVFYGPTDTTDPKPIEIPELANPVDVVKTADNKVLFEMRDGTIKGVAVDNLKSGEKYRIFTADKISNNKEVYLSPTSETTDSKGFTAREYNLGGLVADSSRTITITGKVLRKNTDETKGIGTVVGNKAVFTANETPTEKKPIDTTLPAYDKNKQIYSDDWRGSKNCTVNKGFVTPGDNCDQVYNQIPPTDTKMGNIKGKVWLDNAGNGNFESNADKPTAGVKVKLYRGKNGSFDSLVGETTTDATGSYQFKSVPEGSDYYVSFDRGGIDEKLAPGTSNYWNTGKTSLTDNWAFTDKNGLTPNFAVTAGKTTNYVNSAFSTVSTSITVTKTMTDETGEQDLGSDVKTDPNTPVHVKIRVKNTGTEGLKLDLKDETIMGDDLKVDFRTCTTEMATGVKPDDWGVHSGDTEFSVSEPNVPEAVSAPNPNASNSDFATLNPGESLTCVGLLENGVKINEPHENKVTVTGTGTKTGIPVKDDSTFKVTTDPEKIPTAEIKVTKGLIDGSGNFKPESFENQAMKGDSERITFKVENTGEDTLLDVDLGDLAVQGPDKMENITCEALDPVSGFEGRRALLPGKSMLCHGDLTYTATGKHEDRANVVAVASMTGKLVEDEDNYVKTVVRKPVILDLPVLGEYSYLILAGLVLTGAIGSAYTINRRRKIFEKLA